MPLGWLIGGGALLGAIVGSFLATIVIRWPKGISVATGRSCCDDCGAALSPVDLVPILSYLQRGGTCVRCGGAINPRHIGIEIGAALIGALALAISPNWDGLTGALFCWILLALAVLDAEHFWLPDALVLPLGVAGLALGPAPLLDRMIGAAAGYLSFEMIRILYAATRGREGLGGGDSKLLGAIGAWLGWMVLPFVVLGASVAGLLWIVIRMTRGRRVSGGDRLPLGTLLAMSGCAAWVAGAQKVFY